MLQQKEDAQKIARKKKNRSKNVLLEKVVLATEILKMVHTLIEMIKALAM